MMAEIQFKKEFHGCGMFTAFYTWLVKQLPKDLAFVEAYTAKTNIKMQGILEHLGLSKAGENKNGRSFFLPATGHKENGSKHLEANGCGNYWSSTPDGLGGAFSYIYGAALGEPSSSGRFYGFAIRPVFVE